MKRRLFGPAHRPTYSFYGRNETETVRFVYSAEVENAARRFGQWKEEGQQNEPAMAAASLPAVDNCTVSPHNRTGSFLASHTGFSIDIPQLPDICQHISARSQRKPTPKKLPTLKLPSFFRKREQSPDNKASNERKTWNKKKVKSQQRDATIQKKSNCKHDVHSVKNISYADFKLPPIVDTKSNKVIYNDNH